ncbi:MAG: xylose isomerase [Oscillospiraceae bacterium]|nr:xylose isomerase [Oscillospiraceae bacterium]MDD4368034.1 xylose isomerase [Oscillospiraceae bacterium]
MQAYYPTIPKIRYEGAKSDNPLAFKYYDPEAVVAGKSMREQLRFAMSYWHTMVAAGTDMFGVNTMDKSYGSTDPMTQAEHKAHAAFELMDKLDLDFFCFHDRDISPEADNLKETDARLDKITALLKQLMKDYHKKLLWGTANLFGNPRYMNGAGTSPSADVYAFAAAQLKKAVEITVELGGNGYVFWGGREGYETLLNTDMAFELDNMARLMHMVVDYARSIGFKGDFYIEPKPKEPMKHQYDFDAATALNFLRAHDLLGDFKLNIEANHATLAQHTFQHELRTAAVNGAFGSVDANQGDLLLGWDTDQFPTNVYDTTLAMLEILKAGGFTNGGLNFDAKARRASNTVEDIFYSYIAGMDAFALGLRLADKVQQDGRLDKFVAERYSSFQSGIGKLILDGKASLPELEAYALKQGDVKPQSGRQEYLESILNQIMFG